MRTMPVPAVTYGLVDETYSYHGHTYISYGIVAYVVEEPAFPTVVASVHNITSDREGLSRLVSLCNQQELSLAHLDDVIDDFLNAQP